jgi:hypothetical protein
MSRVLQRIKKFWREHLSFQYFTLVFTRWQAVLWGGSVLAVAWGLHFIVALINPPVWVNWTAVLVALFFAGYYVWREDHVRLMPKFNISEICAQVTETNDPHTPALYVQIIPKCLTDAPVHECRGHLLRVSTRFSPEEKWKLTDMNSPIFLEWDYYGIPPQTLEPGIDRRLNVCHWSSANSFVVPAVNPLPSKFKSVFDSSDTFKFDIRVTAKDCASVDVSVTVNVTGRKWDDPVIELIQGDGK